jgi:sulfate adenylyltransferase large subunit
MTSEAQLIRSDINEYLRRYQNKELLRFVAVGSVDDGKSTLIGRLLYDTGSVYEDQLQAVRKATQMRGTDLDLSLITDGLAAEREQGITIDVAYRYFNTDKRKFIIADTPGHVQYTRNMVTGASTAHVALVLIDARLGVLQQSRRHATIASLLGTAHLAVCINKMDLVAYAEPVFVRIRDEFAAFTKELGFHGVTFFPISALEGANCVHRSEKTPWYRGPTVLEYLETVPLQDERNFAHFRYPVQYVLRPSLDYRGFAGCICSGIVRKGDRIAVVPSGKTSRVKAIDSNGAELDEAFAPQSVTLRLEDEVDVSRGDMLVHAADRPDVARTFDAHLVWMHEMPLDPTRNYLLKHTTQLVRAAVARVHWRKDMDSLQEVAAASLALNDIGRVTLTAHRPLFLDPYKTNRETGSFILIDPISNNTVGAGMVITTNAGVDAGKGAGGVDETAARSGAEALRVSAAERRARFGLGEGGIVLIEGVARRVSEVAYRLERRLFERGVLAIVFDSSHVATPLAAARVVADSGLVTIVAATSPLSDADRSALEEGRLLRVALADASTDDDVTVAAFDALMRRRWIGV